MIPGLHQIQELRQQHEFELRERVLAAIRTAPGNGKLSVIRLAAARLRVRYSTLHSWLKGTLFGSRGARDWSKLAQETGVQF